MGWLTWEEEKSNMTMRHAWHPLGEKRLHDAHVWADGYIEETNTVYSYYGCYIHAHLECLKTPYNKTTYNPTLKMSMGDIALETKRWEKRVKRCGYNLVTKFECEWMAEVANCDEKKEHVTRMGMAGAITSRSALYGGRTEAIVLHAMGNVDNPINYIDVVSLYPYVCKWKKYPIGHPEVIIGPKLHGRSVDEFEGFIRCTVLPPTNLYLPLLPSKINGKLVFALCRKCAELQSITECRHSPRSRALTETWTSMEVQKAVALGYTVTQIHEVWHYSSTTQYDHTTGEGGLFSKYMNDFITQKMEASGYPSNVVTDQEKLEYVEEIKEKEGVTLDPKKVKKNPGARAVAKLCLNNLWGKLAQRPNMTQQKYTRSPREFFEIISSDKYDVHDCHFVDEDCVYLTYKNSRGFEEPSPNTNPVIASYVTSHARLELYKYLEMLGERVLYCDTDSVIYRSSPGDIHPPLSDAMGGMTDELEGSFITEFTSNGAKTYGYKTSEGGQVIKCKGFTLNKLTSDKITFNVMRDLATGDCDSCVTVDDPQKIRRDPKRRRLCTTVESKTFKRTFDKRIMRADHTSVPYGYR